MPWGVARTGGEQVDDQQMDASQQGLIGLAHEGAQFGLAALIARRDDLDHRDDLVATAMTDHNRLGFPRILVHLGPGMEPGLGWRRGDCNAARSGHGFN